jgi:hypothetical protein
MGSAFDHRVGMTSRFVENSAITAIMGGCERLPARFGYCFP